MIILTSITGQEFCLNSELIYKIEEVADTIVTLTDGKVVRVSNMTQDIINRIVEYKRQIYVGLPGGK